MTLTLRLAGRRGRARVRRERRSQIGPITDRFESVLEGAAQEAIPAVVRRADTAG